jgi:hypothetical protein
LAKAEIAQSGLSRAQIRAGMLDQCPITKKYRHFRIWLRGGGPSNEELKMRITVALLAAIVGVVTFSAPLIAQQKTEKACQEEWRANRAANEARGITEKSYVSQCRMGSTMAPAPAASTPSPARTTTGAAPAAAGAYQYTTETQAKGRCRSATVVWANLESKIYHFAGHKDYGHTEKGAYMCETDATREGMRAAKNENRP